MPSEVRRLTGSRQTTTRVSSRGSMPRAWSASSSRAGSENGVTRTSSGKPASVKVGNALKVAAKVVESGAAVVSYVLGTEHDPQGFAAQQQLLREAGCIVTETAARAALAAAALVLRAPALASAGV